MNTEAIGRKSTVGFSDQNFSLKEIQNKYEIIEYGMRLKTLFSSKFQHRHNFIFLQRVILQEFEIHGVLMSLGHLAYNVHTL